MSHAVSLVAAFWLPLAIDSSFAIRLETSMYVTEENLSVSSEKLIDLAR